MGGAKGGGRLTEPFSNLSSGIKMDEAVHSLCKISA